MSGTDERQTFAAKIVLAIVLQTSSKRRSKGTLFMTNRELKVVLSIVIAVFAMAGMPLVYAAEPAADVEEKARQSQEFYTSQVKPLLKSRCYACHGALKQQSGLRLDTAASISRGGDSGPVVQVDDANKSRLLARVSASDPAERMPPEHEGEPLAPEQIDIIRQWIASGARGPADEPPEVDPRNHWAFRPIVRPVIPQAGTNWGTNPIDAFVAARHQKLGLQPQPEAPRLWLLRRLSIDLIGLPPTPAEIAAFESDQETQWYERAVTRLLDDPRHGERWARHWMDIWRYSDWWGLGDQLRNSQPHIWHWRDWIVESLNADTPYDEMVRLMLAADELHPNDLDKLRASGFLARNYFLFNRNQWMDETVEHVSKAFLGLTMNCSKCHDHKYDPISQVDYYRMRAFFEPYHARIDVIPGEADLTRDGIPRAFDGLPDLPTYRFVRGQEKDPDKSAVIAPGIPQMLEFSPLAITPVDLPIEAWQPERRDWVADAYLSAAATKREAATAKLAAARQKLAESNGTNPVADNSATGWAEKNADGSATPASPVSEAASALRIAEFEHQVAQAEELAVQHRVAAMQSKWKASDNPSGNDAQILAEAAREAARTATRSERQAAAARAQLAVVEAELREAKAAADKKEAATNETKAARETLEKAQKSVEEPSEQFTPFAGARWTPTRFFDSGKDDPTVTFHPQSTGRRKALAQWITDPRNPLTARVAVNHVWNRHFGTPLVPTVFDFGRKGISPTNPELLDWLAAEFIESGWSMKHLHRLIVTSATYRLSSVTAHAHAHSNSKIDSENINHWRRTPMRIESQAVRDSILYLAGKLDATRGGPPVPLAAQVDSTRRSLYFYHSNNERNLFLTTFDEALVKECYRREQSIVPQQALALTNSRLVLDASKAIADRLTTSLADEKKSADDNAAFVRLAFAVLLATEPSEAEVAASLESIEAWKKLPEIAGTERANFVWVLLNHNDFVTVR